MQTLSFMVLGPSLDHHRVVPGLCGQVFPGSGVVASSQWSITLDFSASVSSSGLPSWDCSSTCLFHLFSLTEWLRNGIFFSKKPLLVNYYVFVKGHYDQGNLKKNHLM